MTASCWSLPAPAFRFTSRYLRHRFARLYNAAQLVAAPCVGRGDQFRRPAESSPLARNANRSVPALGGRTLQQSCGAQSSSRVCFGERWVEQSAIEIFREDIARFRVIMTNEVEEDSLEALERGAIPQLAALRLHNSTVWRWNRVCYGILDGRPHLRIEIRFLPAGPTVLDEVANAAFQFGLLASVDQEYGPVDKKFRFEDVKYNFLAAARHGLGAQFIWSGEVRLPAGTLILEHLLPLARAGLKSAEIAS